MNESLIEEKQDIEDIETEEMEIHFYNNLLKLR